MSRRHSISRFTVGLFFLVVAPCSAQEISLRTPTPEELFRPRTEIQSRRAIFDANRQQGITRVEFPKDAKALPIIDANLIDRPRQVITYRPNVICFQPLYFEDAKSEWHTQQPCGVLDPVRSAVRFYGRAFCLPGRMVVTPPGSCFRRRH